MPTIEPDPLFLKEEVAFLREELAQARAELSAANRERDNWKAHAISRGKRLRKTGDKFCWIMGELEDEGDRVYFGSSNHADEFKEAVAWLNDFQWDKVMGEPEDWDLLGALEKARAELSAAREALAPFAALYERTLMVARSLSGEEYTPCRLKIIDIRRANDAIARIDALKEGGDECA